MEGLKWIPYLFLVICIAGVIGGATAITLSKFAATTTDTQALYVINNASAGVVTIAGQLGTVSIIGVMVIIISVLAGLFAYFRFFSGGQ